MSNKKLVLFVFVIVLMFGVWKANQQNVSQDTPNIKSAHKLVFYDEKSFLDGVSWAKKNESQRKYKIVGGIIPHHLEVGFVLAGFYNHLAKQQPHTIILIGPNHYERGEFKVLTSLFDWKTPFGRVSTDQKLAKWLVEKKLAQVDEETLPNDHAVAGSMAFIKYYMPETKVVPLLLSGRMSKDEADVLANKLKDVVGEKVVLVAAVDFSHYLTNVEAQKKDKITLNVIKGFEYQQLFRMNNDYLDSPPSIGTLLMVMQKLGAKNMDVLYHANSGEIQKNNSVPTTSYFSIAYY